MTDALKVSLSKSGVDPSDCAPTEPPEAPPYAPNDRGRDSEFDHGDHRSRRVNPESDDEPDDGPNETADPHPDARSTSKDEACIKRVRGSQHDLDIVPKPYAHRQ
jgi:hypothetical protein